MTNDNDGKMPPSGIRMTCTICGETFTKPTAFMDFQNHRKTCNDKPKTEDAEFEVIPPKQIETKNHLGGI